MGISLLYERFFELINFVFLCACLRYVYRKYGSPALAQAMQHKKDVFYALQHSVVTTKQQAQKLDQDILDQEAYGNHLVASIAIWFKKEEDKKHKNRQECLALKQQLVLYTAAQEQAVILHDTQKELLPEVLEQVRQHLITQYQSPEAQRHAIAQACQHMTQGVR